MIKRISVLITWFGFLAVLLCAALYITKPVLNADMFSLLPKSHSQLAYGEEVFFKKNANRIMFSFTGDGKNLAHDELKSWLLKRDIKNSFELPSIEQLSSVFSAYQHALLSDNYKNSMVDKAQFESFYLTQLNQLGNPFVSATLKADISLSLAAFIGDNLKQSQLFSLKNERLTCRLNHTDYAVILATIPNNSLPIDESIKLASSIKNKLESLNDTYPQTTIRYSGALFHTAENAQQAKYEMSLFGGLSVIALLLMVFWVFRQVSSILLASLTVLSALAGGATAMVFVFNSIHLLTLVFAVTLIGIAIDYAFHAMTDLAYGNSFYQSSGLSKGTKTALLLSFITTGLGYSCLLGAPISLLSQVAVFVIAGLASAWLFTLIILPIWQSKLVLSERSLIKSQQLLGLMVRFNRYKQSVLLVLGLVLMFLFYLKPISFNNDVRLLNASPQQLILNEQKHLTLLGQLDAHIVFLFASNAEQLLQKQERLIDDLKRINPHLKHNAIKRWLPSKRTQENNLALFNGAVKNDVLTITEKYTGIKVESANTELLSYDALVNSHFSVLLNAQMFVEPNKAVTWFSVSGVSTQALTSNVNAYEDAFIYNKPKQISSLLENYSQYLLLTLGVAIVICFVLFSYKFGLRIGTVQVITLSASLLTMLWVCNAAQGSISIFNLLGGLLIIGLAIDYLVFYQINNLTAVNVLAISLSAASSMCVFGMLTFSNTPAIFSFGLTVMVGILAVYILSPLSVLKSQKE
ncbi:transporter [Pseudoalteromonas carrageenovora]|uniref:transporter n=1 Tax=Pseudoalteromonas carrageenovora TaxID=227 RepID=UPI0021184FF4|nr:transporter [Pseudoalteromonas carrageenovora]MCQ8889888.1 transporter [Pseudoalteromonas carrageenovora]